MAHNIESSTQQGHSLTPPETLAQDGYSRWAAVEKRIGFSREWVRQREKEGRFPKRVHLSQRCVVWPNREIHRWLADPVNYRAEG